MAKFKDREAKEAPYVVHNNDVLSVCNGSFYIKGRNIHEPCKNREKCQKYAKYKEKKEDTPEVGFYYVDSFRKCDLWKKMELQAELALRIAIYNILYVNDLACACVIDMKDKVKNQDKEAQKIVGALVKRQELYESKIREILGEMINSFAVYNDNMDEYVSIKIQNFRNAILQFLKQHCVENAEFITASEIARTMIGYSIISIENRIRECCKYNKDIVNLRQYKLSEFERIANNLCDWVSRKCKNLNLNESVDILNRYKELDKTLTDCNIINESIIKSMNHGV